jgi:hypothetical protein
MNCLKTLLDQEPRPAGRQVHVDQKFHFALVRSTSRSWARHAA